MQITRLEKLERVLQPLTDERRLALLTARFHEMCCEFRIKCPDGTTEPTWQDLATARSGWHPPQLALFWVGCLTRQGAITDG